MKIVIFFLLTIGALSGAAPNDESLFLKELGAFVDELESNSSDSSSTSESTSASSTLSPICEAACPKDLKTPDCGDRPMSTVYNETCNCPIEHQCCPTKCEKNIKKECNYGTFPVETVDCCDCPVTKCDPCPSVKVPTCDRKECEGIIYEKTSDGCPYPICKTSCPPPKNLQCPNCLIPEEFINGTLCGCTQQRCIVKKCAEMKKLKAKDYPCHDIIDTHDGCGCKIQRPVGETYCKKFNKEAKERKCHGEDLAPECYENSISEKSDSCGCDTSQCALKNEECTHVFETRDCPKDHFMVRGLTPCGKARDACIQCPKVQECEDDCYENVDEENEAGCPVRICQKKVCSICKIYEENLDKCGCPNCLSNVTSSTSIVFQRRTIINSDFNKNWNSYKEGFTLENGDFWLGLDKLHEITSKGKWKLEMRVKIKSSQGWRRFVVDQFTVRSEKDKYSISFSSILKKDEQAPSDYHINYMNFARFSTRDQDNDKNSSSCADSYSGGWWFNSCHYICLNCKTDLWRTPGNPSVSETEMIIRRE